jgi:RNA polymerase sigma-70 factor (ECF subfamily)
MDRDSAPTTSITLLARLRRSPADPGAWQEFVRRYGRQIYRWCRRWNLQDADAQDVVQTVFLVLTERMKEFTYDPSGSFRAWLRTVAHNAWKKFVARKQQPGQGSGDSQVAELLAGVASRDDLAARLEEEYDWELFETAMLLVRQRVEPRIWEAFRLLALEGLSGAEAAQRLGMKVATVFVAKSRVQKMLQEEIGLLDRPAAGALEVTP